MPIISLPTGKSIHVSTYEWLFQLEEEDVDDFYKSCIADDLGTFINNPFSDRTGGKLELEIEDFPEEIANELDIQD